MNKQKNYRRRQRGITPITTPRNSPGVAQFSMSEVAQFSVSLDSNPILLELGMAMRGAELPFWCGFREAKKLGIFPRKGSKSVRILRPQLHSS